MHPPDPDTTTRPLADETAALRRRLRRSVALSVMLACVVAALIGYLFAAERSAPPPAEAVAVAAAPAIVPAGPAGVRHPTFDCQSFTGEVGALPGDTGRAIAGLSALPAGQRVRTRGKVMAAYPRIRGFNWLHLCDAPGGDVLVVATADWAHPGDAVIVEGILTRDADIGGVYRFPLLIESGRLEGPGVIEGSAMPGATIDL